MRSRIKQRLPLLRRAWLRMSRLRWLAKLRVVRYTGAPLLSLLTLRYLLWDPEVESHTYELENPEHLAEFAATAFGITPERARALYEETLTDPALTSELARRTRWSFHLKSPMPLGQRAMWWVLVRARKPQVVVETGIYRGLGSLVVLRALERNAQEGAPGHLISVDVDERAGELVPRNFHDNWTKLAGSVFDVLPAALEGRRVDVLFHDTPHTDEFQDFEFGLALEHGGPQLTLVDSSGGQASTLRRLSAEHGAPIHRFSPVARDHIYQPPGIDVLTIRR